MQTLSHNMKAILAKYKFDGVWHFTDRSNLQLTMEHKGLFSLGEIERRGIEIPVLGGNKWSHDADKIAGVHEYIHLAFIDDHPMLYRAKQEGRIPDPIWLKISSSILLWGGVRFCSEVSNKSGATILKPEEVRNILILMSYLPTWIGKTQKFRYDGKRQLSPKYLCRILYQSKKY